MPSAEHETPVALATSDPELMAWLLASVFKVSVPDYHHFRSQATDVWTFVPRTYRADGMVVFCDKTDRPQLATVFEVQRSRDAAKRRTWKLYLAQLEAEVDADAALLVFCPDKAVARWYRDRFDLDNGLSLLVRPFIFTPSEVPLIMDPERAVSHPALAVLATICHSGEPEIDAAFPALLEAIRSVDRVKEFLYHDVVLAGLPEAARTRWEVFVTTTAGPYYSERFRSVYAEGRAEGEAEGEARSVLAVLNARGIAVPDVVREHILACTDSHQLILWVARAATVATAEEVIRD